MRTARQPRLPGWELVGHRYRSWDLAVSQPRLRYAAIVAWPFRVTDPLLEVLEVLLAANASLHGWAIMKETQRSGPTVYQVLERLRKARWVECWWEDEKPPSDAGPSAPAAPARPPDRTNVPRRRYYRLSGEGAAQAPVLLAERGRHRRESLRLQNRPGLVTFGPPGLSPGGTQS